MCKEISTPKSLLTVKHEAKLSAYGKECVYAQLSPRARKNVHFSQLVGSNRLCTLHSNSTPSKVQS